MNHRKRSRKFGRTGSHRKAMFMNLAISLIKYEMIKTTVIKAKELRGFIEPLITISAESSLATRRRLIAKLRNKEAVVKLIDDLGPFFKERPGGYLRVLKCGLRPGDAAPMAYVLLTGRKEAAES